MRMGIFNSDDHYIYYCEGSLKRNGLALIVNKRVQNSVLGCNPQNNRMIWSPFQSKPFNIQLSNSMPQILTLKKLKLNISVKDLQQFLELTSKKMSSSLLGNGMQKWEARRYLE